MNRSIVQLLVPNCKAYESFTIFTIHRFPREIDTEKASSEDVVVVLMRRRRLGSAVEGASGGHRATREMGIKLRVRIAGSGDTMRVEVPEVCTLSQLRAAVATKCFDGAVSPENVAVTLNRTDDVSRTFEEFGLFI